MVSVANVQYYLLQGEIQLAFCFHTKKAPGKLTCKWSEEDEVINLELLSMRSSESRIQTEPNIPD